MESGLNGGAGGGEGDAEDTSGARGATESIKSGSSYWAGRQRKGRTASLSDSSGAFTAGDGGGTDESSLNHHDRASDGDENKNENDNENDNDSQGTETPGDNEDDGGGGGGYDEVMDEVGAQDAFVAGMIYALSRKIMPGAPYTPIAAAVNESTGGRGGNGAGMATGVGLGGADDKQRWRLDECLR